MADDRQPPQSYDTVAPAGVGAATTNQMSPRAWQDLYLSGDQGLLDVAMEEIQDDALSRFMQSIPPGDVIASWPDVDGAPPLQTSSPAGVGSPGSQSYRSIQTTPLSSPDTPPSWGSATPTPRTARGGRTAAGAGGDGNGGGRRGPRTRGGGRGAGGAGGGAGGGGGGAGRGGAGGAGGAGGGGRRGGRRGRRTPTSPLTPASNATTPRGSWSPGRQPRTLNQADLQRRLRMMLQDQEQLAQGRDISTVTMTNSIVSSYKQGGAPSVQTSSSRVSP